MKWRDKMENCQVLDLIKKLDTDLQMNFSLEDLKGMGDCEDLDLKGQIKTYVKLGILEKKEDGSYMIKNMCMLSQF